MKSVCTSRVSCNLDPDRVRMRTRELMSGVSQPWTDLDLRSQFQERTSGVRRKAENQAVEGGWRCQGPRTLHLYHLWPRTGQPGYLTCIQCSAIKYALNCINALMPL